MKRHTINISAVKHLTLNPATSPPPKPTTGSVKSTLHAGGPNKLFNIHSLPVTPSKSLTDYLTMLKSHPHVKEKVLKERFMQTTLPSITEGTFFAIGHTDVSMAGSEITATKYPQASSLQLSEESESDLSTVFPFESNLAKSTELMPDLPVMQRRMRIASPDFLSGLAQISDDICGSGNYTAEMRLTLERDIMPGDLVPALGNLHVVINLKTNNTQVNLEIKSCCLSPTVRLDEFNTTCCLFSRLPIDPQGIHLLPTVLSKRASFTISLFQMINYSTAYLHCDLSVCLRNNSECERCQQHRNAHYTDDGEVLFSSTGNRISFGPVLKEADDSAIIETAELDVAEAAVILGSVSGCFLVCIALMLLWTSYRHHLQRSGHCQCWTSHGCSRNGEHFLP
ncbi:uromodulin-like 1 [Colossoma macropomum]|uniref:uromodulin-like 1 n=1 Tax=Colossoma macropomum TaxID=42526 RepID=UPI0018641CC2|nr:uromodulin-like 1 [Colossoma macropomum]